jgi:hypothetical protein
VTAPSGASAGARVSLVISVWNRQADLRDNLRAIAAQTVPPGEVIVVDNCSTDGTAEMVRAEFPQVKLIRMPHSRYGACETFNIGFASAAGEFVGILDDDVVLPPTFVEHMLAKFATEPETTAILSPKVIEPEMPDWYRDSPAVNQERFLPTFRGCGSMARHGPIAAAGYYDARLFIFGNERDLATRLLNRGFRVKMVPAIEVFHKAPFGMRHGARSPTTTCATSGSTRSSTCRGRRCSRSRSGSCGGGSAASSGSAAVRSPTRSARSACSRTSARCAGAGGSASRPRWRRCGICRTACGGARSAGIPTSSRRCAELLAAGRDFFRGRW